jgi:radical SAM superfamily enzyme YgiQ (UPF0313 family)
LRQPLREKVESIANACPRILGISVSIWNHRASLELLKILEEVWLTQGHKPVVVLGGPEVSNLPPDSEIFRYADWVVQGEGEDVFRDLCRLILDGHNLPVKRSMQPPLFVQEIFQEKIALLPSVKSISGKFIRSKPVDLAAIDSGYRLYTDEDISRKLIYVEASRGCPFGCEFCLSSLDKTVRYFPLEAFLDNIKNIIMRRVRIIKFLDRSFNLDTSVACRIIEFFLTELKIHQLNSGRFPSFCVHFEMVPFRFPWELRQMLKCFPAGSLRLEIGIQTLNPRVAALIGRPGYFGKSHVEPIDELEALDFLQKETEALVHADLIAGLPGEDISSFAEGFDRLWLMQPAEIQLGILKCLPGTPISRYNAVYNMHYASGPPYEVLETSAMPAHDLDKIKNFARFWEIIINRKNFTKNVTALFPSDKPVFLRFMAVSAWLLERFGRNWGIDRKDLQAALEEWENCSICS